MAQVEMKKLETPAKANKTIAPTVKEIAGTRRFVRSTPDKLRRVGALVIKKDVSHALAILEFAPMQAARPLALTIKQVLDQAKDKNIDTENLKISQIRVDEGPKLKRRRIVHQGRATAILKRMAHVTVVLSEQRKFEARNSKQEA